SLRAAMTRPVPKSIIDAGSGVGNGSCSVVVTVRLWILNSSALQIGLRPEQDPGISVSDGPMSRYCPIPVSVSVVGFVQVPGQSTLENVKLDAESSARLPFGIAFPTQYEMLRPSPSPSSYV